MSSKVMLPSALASARFCDPQACRKGPKLSAWSMSVDEVVVRGKLRKRLPSAVQIRTAGLGAQREVSNMLIQLPSGLEASD